MDSHSQQAAPLVKTADSSNVAQGERPLRPWLMLLALSFGLFMSLLDTTIVNIALTDIQNRLHAGLLTTGWVVAAYNLTFAVLLVTIGRIADQYGRKRLFLLGMVLFSLGSLFCALAPSIEWLIGWRVLQAAGGAALNPISLAIITAVFPPEKRGAALGIWGAQIGLAAACGPILGGFLVQAFTWRSIFFVNLPFCLLGILMVTRYVPETSDLGQSKRLDVMGTLLLSCAFFCLVFALTKGGEWGWLSWPTLTLFVVALLSFALFLVVEARQEAPLVDLRLFRIASFSFSNVTMFLFNISWQGPLLILTLYFQRSLGYDALHAAYALLPVPLAVIVTSIVMGRFEDRIKFIYTALTGLALYTLGLGLYLTLAEGATAWDTTWRSLLVGVGAGMTYQSLPNLNLADVPRARLGVASGVYNTCRQIGLTLSAAILLSVLYAHLSIDHAQGHMLDAFKASWLYATCAALLAWLSILLLFLTRRRGHLC